MVLVCVDTSLPSSTVITQGNERFQHLRTLDVGPSPLIAATLDVATYLSGILPEECQLTWRFYWHHEDRDNLWKGWDYVYYTLSSLVCYRKAAREAAAAGAKLNLSIYTSRFGE